VRSEERGRARRASIAFEMCLQVQNPFPLCALARLSSVWEDTMLVCVWCAKLPVSARITAQCHRSSVDGHRGLRLQQPRVAHSHGRRMSVTDERDRPKA
jgi:hypothetical protein